MDPFFWQSVVVGFLAQFVDGALGMAYGLVSTSFLMALGVPPASASAAVHTAEIFSTGVSGAAHTWRRNVNWSLVLRLAPAGIVGGVAGAVTVAYLPIGIIKPIVSVYLLGMGAFVLWLAFRNRPQAPAAANEATGVGLIGGFLDAAGGGGWGPISTTTLLGRGHAPRQAVGSVNVSEFFVTAAISATFFMTLGGVRWTDIAGLIIGGVAAAPLAAFAVGVVKPRLLMGVIGCFVSALSIYQIVATIDPNFTFLASLRRLAG
jgi:uncharacterized membrane protein YfcA